MPTEPGSHVVLLGDESKVHRVKHVREFGGMGDTIFTECGKLRLLALTDETEEAVNCKACEARHEVS